MTEALDIRRKLFQSSLATGTTLSFWSRVTSQAGVKNIWTALLLCPMQTLLHLSTAFWDRN